MRPSGGHVQIKGRAGPMTVCRMPGSLAATSGRDCHPDLRPVFPWFRNHSYAAFSAYRSNFRCLVGSATGVAERHVVGRHRFGDRARRSADTEEPPCHFLASLDLRQRTVEAEVEADVLSLLMSVHSDLPVWNRRPAADLECIQRKSGARGEATTADRLQRMRT